MSEVNQTIPKRIPYGMADYGRFCEENAYYVDKTHYIPMTEAAPFYQEQAAVRDHLNGEKVIQGFLIAYLNVTHNFLTWSEREMGGGFVDLYLEPFLGRYPDMKYGYLIELEYISNTKFEKPDFDKSLAKEKAEAEGQLRQYASDPRIEKVAQQVTLKKLALVYRGWELVYAEEVI